MKKRKINTLLGAIFALAMAVSAGTTLSFAKSNKHPEIVLAEEETNPETPVTDEEEAPSTDNDEAVPTKEESESSSEETATGQAPSISEDDILSIIVNTFKDAIKDLINHFKRWLSFFK